MAVKLYVGNLNYQTQGPDLQALFEQYGEVASVNVVLDRETGRSRGFAFVEMADQEGAEAAETALNGFDFEGRRLKVNEARPRGEGGGPGRH